MHCSNNCPNLHYCVQQMGHSKESCHDLAFLVPLGLKESDDMPMPFVVYHNSQDDAEQSARFLRSRVSSSLRRRIVWVHLGMSDQHKISVVEKFRDGELIGLTSTESLGLA